MKKTLVTSAAVLLSLVVVAGSVGAYIFFSVPRGGGMKPPESARNAPEAPKFDASQTPPTASIEAKKAPEYELPTDLKLPTEFKIQTPSVPDGIDAPAGGEKT